MPSGVPSQTAAEAVAALRRELGENLYSCCLYGSAVRGNAIAGVSDVNLLIVLERSDPAAQDAVARAIGARRGIDPFVLESEGFVRSVRAFAAKFSSIQRNYRVLWGADPLAEITLDPALEKFLCEQALRNLRLRLAYSYVTRARHQTHGRFMIRSITPLFLRLSEIVRLQGQGLPVEFGERVAVFENFFGMDGQVLRALLALKKNPATLVAEDVGDWHARFFSVVDSALRWIEQNWPVGEAPEI